jgi:NAD+ diphosphatase
MTALRPSRPNTFSGGRLDRAGLCRHDDDWVAARLDDPASRFLPVWRSRNLVRSPGEGAAEIVALGAAQARPFLARCAWALLGIEDGRAVFALDLSAWDDPLPDGPGRFEDLRALATLLAAEDAALLAHARALMHWRVRHRFCGVCGARCAAAAAGHVMHCSGCGAHHFPRTDPAVIMLVSDGERALLGHPARFPERPLYTTLAGFVEPGETLEEAVARETLEEAGIRVGAVSYHSSQPWPFPANIMIGFHAEAISLEIRIDRTELLDARWFTREELRAPEAHGFTLPPELSIARRLIEDWIAAPRPADA